ncbi:MAG: hypothetical protein Q7J72_08525 [Candidatus Omnitrophota bacterium]|nr:hypothetical protein [Candidatus Omnitrophota bacterium]
MRKKEYFIFGVGVLISCVVSLMFSRTAQASDESLTLETYYPAPYGIYSELTTTNSTYLATEGGNVGIGNTDPVYALDIQRTDNAASTAASIYNAGNRGVAVRLESDNHSYSVRVGGTADALPGRFVVRDLTNSENRLVVERDGDVGIGITNPGSYDGKEAKFDVGGYAAVDDIYLKTPRSGNARWASRAGILSSSCTWTGPMCLTGGGRQISCPADTVVTAIRTGQGCGGDTHAIELKCCLTE